MYGLSVSHTGLRAYDAILMDFHDFDKTKSMCEKINELCRKKLYFVILICVLSDMGMLQRDPKQMCFITVLTICKDFLQIVRKFVTILHI